MSNISAGPVSMIALLLRLLLAAICKRRRTNPTTKITKLTKNAQRLLIEIYWGHLTQLPYPESRDNPLIAAGLQIRGGLDKFSYDHVEVVDYMSEGMSCLIPVLA
jgi:hypothetical protein